MLLGKNYLFLFPSKTHKKFPSQEDKIGSFPSQLQSEQPANRRTTIFYIVPQNGRGKRLQIDPSVLEMLGNIVNTKTNPSAVTNLTARSSERPLFCQPARFLWGTDSLGAPER